MSFRFSVQKSALGTSTELNEKFPDPRQRCPLPRCGSAFQIVRFLEVLSLGSQSTSQNFSLAQQTF